MPRGEKKIAAQGGMADVLAAAHYMTIEHYLYGTYADWYVTFAMTSIVLAFTDRSAYSGQITSDNWYRVVSPWLLSGCC